MKPWHEDDTFWERFAPFMFSEDSWTAAPGEVDQILDLVDVQPGGQVLDLCCGAGRHSLELARRGYKVTGVDRTAAYLAEARGRAEAEGLSVDFVQADMRDFARCGAFDLALSLLTSFSYFENPAENLGVLQKVARSLRPGGRFLVQMMGKEVLARIFKARDWLECNGTVFLREREVTRNWSWMVNRWTLIDGAERFEAEVSHWLYAASELEEILRETGFASVEIYGDLKGSPYDHRARQLIAIGQVAP